MNRKNFILAALLGVLVVCLAYAYLATPRLEKAPPRTAGLRVRAAAKVPGALPLKNAQERIDFTFQNAEPQTFHGAVRDIFRFGKDRPVRTETAAPVIVTPVVTPVVQMPVEALVPFEIVQQSLAKFTFLGFLEKGGEKTVFLSSSGSLFLVKRGERFGTDQEFLVADIAGNLLRVNHARNGLIEIPLIEQQKLNAAVSSPARIQSAPAIARQPKPRVMPNRRVFPPAAAQESAEPFPEMTEETSPEETQKTELPLEEAVLEGDVNGSNQ